MRNRILVGAAILGLSLQARADYVGDYPVGTDNICTIANTYQPSTGAVFALASAAVDVYKDDSDTQDNDSGLTITAFDSLTGTYMVCVDTSSDGTFYSAGSMFHVLVSVGTVDSVSVVGSELMTFSLDKSRLPTIAGYVDTEVAAILDDTGTSGVQIPAGEIDATAVANGAIDAATFAADVDAEVLSYIVDDATRIDASELNTDIDSLAFTVAGDVDANMQGVSGDTAVADRIEALFDSTCGAYAELGIIRGGCTAQAYTHATPSLTLDSPAAFGDNALQNSLVMICSSTLTYCQAATIISNTGDVATLEEPLVVEATGTITYTIYGTPQTSGLLAELGLPEGNLQVQLDYLTAGADDASNAASNTEDILTAIGTPVVDLATDIGSLGTPTEIAREVLDTAVDGTLDVEEMLCYLTAVLVNEMDYNGTDESVFDNAAGDTPMVTITYANGDRTGVTLAACGN